MNLSWRLAWHFLFKAKKSKSLRLFTIISIVSVMFSVLLFLLIDSIVHGLSQNLQNSLIGFESPLFLQNQSDQSTDSLIEKFNQKYSGQKLLVVTSLEFNGLVESLGQTPTGAKVRAVGDAFFKRDSKDFKIYWNDGYDRDTFLKQGNLIVLGQNLYQSLSFLPGDEEEIIVTHPYADLGPSGELEPQNQVLKVAGFFTTGRVDIDQIYAITTIPTVLTFSNETLLSKQNFVYPVASEFLLKDIQHKWQSLYPDEDMKLTSWLDKNQNLFKAIALEKLIYWLVLIFIILISSFNLAGVISIFVVSKSTDTAVLRTLGLKTSQAKLVFAKIGFLLGVLGTAFGLLIGLGLIFWAKTKGFELPESYGFTQLPLSLNKKTLLGLAILTPVLATFIGLLPGRRVMQKTVVEVLRLS